MLLPYTTCHEKQVFSTNYSEHRYFKFIATHHTRINLNLKKLDETLKQEI